MIPMAGEGNRFRAVGVTTPKPLINVGGLKMFELVLANLVRPEVAKIVLIAREEFALEEHSRQLSKVLEIPIHLVSVHETTGGPADSVRRANSLLDQESAVVVANSDQFLAADINGFYSALLSGKVSGSVLVMEDSDPKWSYVESRDGKSVERIVEKEVISKLATVGIYGFASAQEMFDAFDVMEAEGGQVNGELYVGPAYSYLSRARGPVIYENLGPVGSAMHGLGTPEDLANFLAHPQSGALIEVALTRFASFRRNM